MHGGKALIYTIKSGNIEASLSNFGASVNSLKINGVNVVLGFDSIEEYVKSGTYAGATVGRVANRIADGAFSLGGKAYTLNKNDGENHSHGGFSGFDKKFFKVTAAAENSVTMQYLSADGEENYPGNLNLTVTFTVNENSLSIEYSAVSDKDTLWAPTCHAYFNLDGEGSGDCRENLLQINADYYTPLTQTRVPTGEKIRVEGTPFNFNTPKLIGADFGKAELIPTNGYDHNFVLNGGAALTNPAAHSNPAASAPAARAESLKTGVKMELFTDLPCLQLYTGGMIKGAAGKTRTYNEWAGFCLEPQFCPNAINMHGFDKPVLKAGERKTHFIKYFFTEK